MVEYLTVPEGKHILPLSRSSPERPLKAWLSDGNWWYVDSDQLSKLPPKEVDEFDVGQIVMLNGVNDPLIITKINIIPKSMCSLSVESKDKKRIYAYRRTEYRHANKSEIAEWFIRLV